MLAGILNRFGRIGVIIGFCLGNGVLTYFANGNTIPIITIREILISSLGLLLLPKNVEINIEDLIGKTKYLPAVAGEIEGESETLVKLNSVSETISEIAKSYREVAASTIETDDELKIESKQSFKEELINNIEDFTDNILYDDILECEDEILDEVYDILESNDEITKEEFIKILENNNNYIIGLDEENERYSEIENDINQIIKAINHTYRINKLNLVWKQKEASHKKVIANQLRWGITGNIIIGRRYRRKG